MTRTPLLIVGGGPVGLSAALLAARSGIPCTLIERYETYMRHPKARGVRTRAMELFRLWGLEQEIHEAAPADPELGFVYCRSLTGDEYGRTPSASSSAEHSPTGDCRVPQDELERVLRARVGRTPGIDARFGTALEHLEQDADEVRVTVTDTRTGQQQVLAADYVLAADGAASTVRPLLGVDMDGETIGFWQSVYWHGAIADLTKDRSAIQYLTAAPDGGFVTVAPVDGKERWMTFRMRPAEDGHPGPLTDVGARDLIRAAVGEDRPNEIISTATYQVAAKVARQYRVGRVFLLGDAAHLFPPTGGFGLNTGVQDAHNLMWKLALVHQGHADDGLLDTYEAERMPVARSNADWSRDNAKRFDAVWTRIVSGESAGDPIARQRAHLDALQRDLGFRYDDGALAPASSTIGPPAPQTGLDLTAAIGRRAPHLWIGPAADQLSTLDVFEGQLTLLHGHEGDLWAAAAHAAAARAGVPVQVLRAPGPAFDVDPDTFEQLYGLGPTGAVLVRPDGHIAWRGSVPAADAIEAEVARALETVLGRTA